MGSEQVKFYNSEKIAAFLPVFSLKSRLESVGGFRTWLAAQTQCAPQRQRQPAQRRRTAQHRT